MTCEYKDGSLGRNVKWRNLDTKENRLCDSIAVKVKDRQNRRLVSIQSLLTYMGTGPGGGPRAVLC